MCSCSCINAYIKILINFVSQKKIEMLDSLLEMEVAYSLLKTTKEDENTELHPIDLHYSKLNAEIEVLDRTSKEFELLQIYVKNTHAATHTQYELEIMDVSKWVCLHIFIFCCCLFPSLTVHLSIKGV